MAYVDLNTVIIIAIASHATNKAPKLHTENYIHAMLFMENSCITS